MNALATELRLLPHAIGYELRKATAFRLGFVIREVLRGVGPQAVMATVFYAMFEGTGAHDFSGYRFPDLLAYLVWTAALYKCLVDERTLDISDQIFEGYLTKYLVMPISYFTLLWARFIQFTLVQLLFSALFWTTGALLLPAFWPYPHSALAFCQAAVLLLLGATCSMLAHFTVACLAFWLDVVWSLRNMLQFITMFVCGAVVPIALMPDAAQAALRWSFPYWTVFAPVEILLGRRGSADFAQGVLVLGAWLGLLLVLALEVYRRGLARYAGAGA